MLAVAVADRRILRGVSTTLSFQFVDADGTAAAPAGVVTVGVKKADGTDVIAAGTATAGAGSAPRTVALAAVNTLEFLTATFTDAGDGSTHTQTIEVCGGYFFSVAQARAAEESLKDTVKFPDADIIAARREVEDECERICARAFVPRFRHIALDGSGRSGLRTLDYELRTLRAVTVDGVPYDGLLTHPTLASVTVDRGGALRVATFWPAGVANVVADYEHGWDRPPPELVKAAIVRLRGRLNMTKSDIPDRAERFVGVEGATFELAMPDEFKTGVPEVDAVYQRYSLRMAGESGYDLPGIPSLL